MAAEEIERRLQALEHDWRSVEWSPCDRSMLEYAEQLTRAPQQVAEEQVDRMRQTGWDDRAIHDACSIVAYFAFVNRIADGLGVELESNAEAVGHTIRSEKRGERRAT